MWDIKKIIKKSCIWDFLRKVKNKLKNLKGRAFPTGMDALRLEYAACYEKCTVDPHMILYESYAGRGLICSPYAIFKMFKSRPDFKAYVHVWSVESEALRDELKEEETLPNVRYVIRDTAEYCEALSTAGFLINNLSFPNYFTKKKEQTFINTWHGIPLKTLGFDIPEGRITGLNTIRNFLCVDVFLSPNPFMTERFKQSFLLEGISEGGVMESGMPRNDNLFHTDKRYIIKKLKAAGVGIDEDRKIILYAPTWKGEKYSNPETDTRLYYELIEELNRHIDLSGYQILVKPHQIVYKHILEKGEKLTDKFIPATVDANELLSITDVLISDYSSIYFDYLATKRPIIFYIPDIEEYKNKRGLYFGTDKLPGPIAQSLDELGKLVEAMPVSVKAYEERFESSANFQIPPDAGWHASHAARYEAERIWACGNDDGNVSMRVIDKLIVNKDKSGLIPFNTGGKKKILAYSGDLKPGAVREGLEGWILSADYDKYDITLIVPHTATEPVLNWIIKADKRVRILRRTGKAAVTKGEYRAAALSEKKRIDDESLSPGQRKEMIRILKREVMRTVGMARFDYAVDFSGKALFYQNLFLVMEGTRYVSVKELRELCAAD